MGRAGHLQRRDGLADLAEAGLEPGQQQFALRRQIDGADAALEQVDAQEFLQAADLMAERAWRHAQLLGRLGHAQMPGGGFEGAEAVQGRKRAMHEFF